MQSFILFFIFFFGAAIGSFLNVLIDRLPKGEKITGRSHCDHCHHQLSWQDLLLIVSFFALGGKCRYCHKKLSWQYPMVEMITGLIFLLIFNFQFSIFNENFKFQISNLFSLIAWFGVISCLIVIFFADLKYQIIPDSMQVAFFVFSTIFNFQFLNFKFQILNSFIAALVVMFPILLLWVITKGKGMGFGDVKLAFNIGFLLGLKPGLLALYLAFIAGGVVGFFLLISRKSKLESKIAFGPFIVVGTLIMFFWGEKIMEMIKRIYGF